jgi:hypothetical protein
LKLRKINLKNNFLPLQPGKTMEESVAEALAKMGNEAVLLALVGNTGAKLSRAAAAHLIGRSQSIEPLPAPLAERGDIPTDLIFQFYWWASPMVRAKTIGMAENFDSTSLQSLGVGSLLPLPKTSHGRKEN